MHYNKAVTLIFHKQKTTSKKIKAMTKQGKILIFSGPSGCGKSTIIKSLPKEELNLAFSISATSRAPRGTEKNGVEYFFLTADEFRKKIENGEFIEYAEVYKDRFYGTFKSQIEKPLEKGINVVLDIDVAGGCNIKKIYGNQALSIFILPPSIEELNRRLEKRATDSAENIKERIRKAEYELSFASKYDCNIINDDLETAERETLAKVTEFING